MMRDVALVFAGILSASLSLLAAWWLS